MTQDVLAELRDAAIVAADTLSNVSGLVDPAVEARLRAALVRTPETLPRVSQNPDVPWRDETLYYATPETLDVELEPSDYPRRQASPTPPEGLEPRTFKYGELGSMTAVTYAAERVMQWADHHEPWNPSGDFKALRLALDAFEAARWPDADEELARLAATASPTPPEGLGTALKTFHWLAHPHGCDETKCKGALALAASPAPDPGAGLLRQATLDLDTLLYVRESIEGIQHVGGTVEPLGLIDSIIAIRAEVRGESETDR